MDPQRRNRLKQLVIGQAGTQTLVLNDLLMGDDGAQILADLLPNYHHHLQNIQLKGNNISAFGFEMICNALLDCRGIRSISVQWNMIGLKTNGLNALCKLARNSLTLQKLDLKNNRIDHHSVEPICEIIRMNLKSLISIDLRWNEIGQLGGRSVANALQNNRNLKILLLANNRISQMTLASIQQFLLGITQTAVVANQTKSFTSKFPISQQQFPSMAMQLQLSDLRGLIETEQKQAILYRQKMQIEIGKALQLIRNRGINLQEVTSRMQSLVNQEKTLKEQLKEAQRMLTNFKQNTLKIGFEISNQHTEYKRGKYSMNRESEDLMKKIVEVNDKEISEYNYEMSQKQDYLINLLREKLQYKKVHREKLVDLQEECLRLKLERQSLEYRVTSKISDRERKKYEQVFKEVQERVAQNEGLVNAMKRKNQYLNNELTQAIIKGLDRIKKFEGQIYQFQHKLKKLHDQMTKINLEMDLKHTKLDLKISQELEKQNAISFRRTQVNNLISQGNILLDLVRHEQQQERKTFSQSNEFVHRRMLDLERTIRTQQSNNNMLKNQYQKLCNFLQSQTKNAVYASIFPVN